MPNTAIAWQDALVPLWLVVAWIGYVTLADHPRRGRTTLMARMHQYRQAWMRRMLGRDNRIVDTQIVSLLVQNISFFASSTILIVGGFVAVLGARDQAMGILAEIPFAAHTGDTLWDVKILTLIIIFVYAFFKFTWALRQFNMLSILIGAAPLPGEGTEADAERFARINSLAGDEFNRGIRAYYFGLAAVFWFVQPGVFVAVTTLIVLVLYRRDFMSQTYAAMRR